MHILNRLSFVTELKKRMDSSLTEATNQLSAQFTNHANT